MAGQMVAAAPLLAGGPPGWAAYAGLGLLTVGALILASNSVDVASPTNTATREGAQSCRSWSVRAHAQGDIIGGRGGATIGVPALVKSMPITAAEGVGLCSATYALLQKRQKKMLAEPYAKAIKWINERPPRGALGRNSFYFNNDSNNRFDVDSFGCTPNFIS